MAKKRKSTTKPQQPASKRIEKPPLPPSSSSEESEYESEEEGEEIEEEELDDSDDDSSSDSESESESDEEEEEEEDEDSKRETIKKLLQPFTKDQLINVLKEATANNPSIITEFVASAESDPIHRRIFVYGLGWDATNETLMSAFKNYGPLEDCNVVTDKTTGRAKGYAFVLFKTRLAARKALKQPQKTIGNRTVTCQLASVGSLQAQAQHQNSDASARKLYVANVGPQINVEKLRDFFSKFGEIEDGPLGIDKATGKFRGFAFIIYKTVEGIKKALEEPVKVFDGIKMQCSLAAKNSTHNNNAVESGAGGSSVVTVGNAPVMPSNIAVAGLPMPMGLNQGMVGHNLNPTGAILLGQTPALGVLNPVLGLGLGVGVGAGGMLNHTESLAGGASQPLNRLGNIAPMGLSAGVNVQPGVNTISPSVIGSYGSQAALQGLGAYQTSQLSQPSMSAARSQAGVGSIQPYFGR